MDPLLKTALLLQQSKKRKEERPPRPSPAPRPSATNSPAPLSSEPLPAATRPKNWKVLVQGRWPLVYEEEWEERSAIMTYEGGLPKEEAEVRAYEELVLRHKRLKKYEDELSTHEREPMVALLHKLFDVKIYAMEWSK